MLINQGIVVSTSSVLLVPYAAYHVPKYHEWMKDPDIQALTASEPLSLAAEYAMQKSWLADNDKLTFIIALPPTQSNENSHVETQTLKSNERTKVGKEEIIGDINLFLSPPEEDLEWEGVCVGEVELMIAEATSRRRGFGRGAVLSFLMFVERRLEGVLGEFLGVGNLGVEGKGLMLRVKIGVGNEKSIGLFESVGFKRTAEGVNYFGEVELRFERVLRVGEEAGMEKLGERFGVSGYTEIGYEEEEE